MANNWRDSLAERAFLLQAGGYILCSEAGFNIYRWGPGDWWVLWTSPTSHMSLGRGFHNDLDFRAFLAGNNNTGRTLTRMIDGFTGPLD